MGQCASVSEDISEAPQTLKDNKSILSSEEKQLSNILIQCGQTHLFDGWAKPGTDDKKKHDFFQQVKQLHRGYTIEGGLRAYVSRAKELLKKSKEGANPFEGYAPEIPEGISLGAPYSETYQRLEKKGLDHVGKCGFVLVAGGLGERLGYSSIKIGLPTETLTNTCYLELYCKQILAIQRRYNGNKPVPLAIMVSDDTHKATEALLKKNKYFGLAESQVNLMKQEKVGALTDNEARLAKTDTYTIDAKPHGHGDVHALMHSTGLAKKWAAAGTKWVVFFQDTNGLGLLTLPAMLGVSVEKGFEVNSLAVPRKAKQAVGAITKLKHKDGSEMTVNVEYNQLDPLLKETGKPEGDENDPATGLSPYPGNINQLLFKIEPYITNLNKTSGMMAEFVNPKYADAEKTKFKKPTRLECMMQDYPKVLGKGAKVGFTTAEAWMSYSPAKNAASDAAGLIRNGVPAGSASQAEADQYFYAAELLRQLGAAVEHSGKSWYLDIPVSLGPKIVFDPSFALFPCEIKEKFTSPEEVRIRANGTLVVTGASVFIESVHLDGALRVEAKPAHKVIVKAGYIHNNGYETVSSSATKEENEIEAMRGYKTVKMEEELVKIGNDKEAVIYEGPKDGATAPCVDIRDCTSTCDEPHIDLVC